MPISWTDLALEPRVAAPFLVDPYIPREGIVLLYAKTSRGKSPLTWEIARCVATGTPFFGRATTPGRVLYLEVDTPKMLVHERLMDAELEPVPNVWWEFRQPFNVLVDSSDVQALRIANTEIQPDLVIVNTLRKVYEGDDISSEMAKRVYKRFMSIFPKAAILFCHHERKTRTGMDDANVEEREDFAGSNAWLNDCTVGIQIVRDPRPKGGPADEDILHVRLQHGKSQVSKLHKPIHLALHAGAHWIVLDDEEKAAFVSIWHATEGGNEAKRKAVQEALGMSRTTAGQRARVYGLLAERPGRPSNGQPTGSDLVGHKKAA